MKNGFKKTFIFFAITLIFVSFCAGCAGIPKTARLTISAVPNPVPCGDDGKWYLDLIITENNGIGVTLNSLIFESYNEGEELVKTQTFDIDTIIEWFKTDYIKAFSSIKTNLVTSTVAKYDIAKVKGIDDNGNTVEATYRINFLP